jgi:hypothetical protein
MIANGQLSSNAVSVIGDRRAAVIASSDGEWPSDVAISTNAFASFSILASSSLTTKVASAITGILLSDTMHGSGGDYNTTYR